jgi:hypothetical protein
MVSDKDKLLAETDEAFGALSQVVEGLSEAQMRRVWLGPWGVRDMLVHVSGWHRTMAPTLDRIARGEAACTADRFGAWSTQFIDGTAGAKTADVLAELDASHRDFVRAAGGVPDRHFAPGGPARELLATGAGVRLAVKAALMSARDRALAPADCVSVE